MTKETTKIKTFFTKSMNEEYTSHAWYNTYNNITIEGIKELANYVKEKQIPEIIIVTNIQSARPQRTGGGMPEWFRPDSEYHDFDLEHHSNTFCVALYDNEFTEDEIIESLHSIPATSQIIRLKKNDICI